MPSPVIAYQWNTLNDPEIAEFMYYSASYATSTPDNVTGIDFRIASKEVFSALLLKVTPVACAVCAGGLLDPEIAEFMYYSASYTTSTPDNVTGIDFRIATKNVFDCGVNRYGDINGRPEPELTKRYDFFNQI